MCVCFIRGLICWPVVQAVGKCSVRILHLVHSSSNYRNTGEERKTFLNDSLSYKRINFHSPLPKNNLPSLDSIRRGSIYKSSLICRLTSIRLSWQRTGTHSCRITPIPLSPAQHFRVHLRPLALSWSLASPTRRCILYLQTVRPWRLNNKEDVSWSSEALPYSVK